MKRNAKSLQNRGLRELRKRGLKLKAELEEFLDDFHMYNNPEFWKSIEETEMGKGKRFHSIEELLADLKN